MFRNPEGIAAGKLVDSLDLKGMVIGHAAVSEVHGNFIINQGGASAADILKLIETIRHHAQQKRHIELETEVKILGDDEAQF